MIDTHAHLYFESFDQDRDDVIRQCQDNLTAVINIGVDEPTSRAAVELAGRHDFLYAAVGVHPEEAAAAVESSDYLDTLKTLISQTPKVVAVGEIGLDYHLQDLKDGDRERQQSLFRAQIELALECDLPVIIHSRDAFDDTLRILSEYHQHEHFRGVWHSFTEGLARAQKVLDLGLYLGVNGIVTYPSARELRAAVKDVSLERILLETDAPFLVPQPLRGKIKRNTPWLVGYVAAEVARIRSVGLAEVVAVTDSNARLLFGIEKAPPGGGSS